MEKIKLLSQDYQEMSRVACEDFHLVLAEYKEKAINPAWLLSREDIQAEIAHKMTDDYIYGNSTHPIIQEMAEDAGTKDWTDEDEEIWNYNCELIYIAMRAFLAKHIQNTKTFQGYNNA